MRCRRVASEECGVGSGRWGGEVGDVRGVADEFVGDLAQPGESRVAVASNRPLIPLRPWTAGTSR